MTFCVTKKRSELSKKFRTLKIKVTVSSRCPRLCPYKRGQIVCETQTYLVALAVCVPQTAAQNGYF